MRDSTLNKQVRFAVCGSSGYIEVINIYSFTYWTSGQPMDVCNCGFVSLPQLFVHSYHKDEDK
jgi:hypothetical protein